MNFTNALACEFQLIARSRVIHFYRNTKLQADFPSLRSTVSSLQLPEHDPIQPGDAIETVLVTCSWDASTGQCPLLFIFEAILHSSTRLWWLGHQHAACFYIRSQGSSQPLTSERDHFAVQRTCPLIYTLPQRLTGDLHIQDAETSNDGLVHYAMLGNFYPFHFVHPDLAVRASYKILVEKNNCYSASSSVFPD